MGAGIDDGYYCLILLSYLFMLTMLCSRTWDGVVVRRNYDNLSKFDYLW